MKQPCLKLYSYHYNMLQFIQEKEIDCTLLVHPDQTNWNFGCIILKKINIQIDLFILMNTKKHLLLGSDNECWATITIKLYYIVLHTFLLNVRYSSKHFYHTYTCRRYENFMISSLRGKQVHINLFLIILYNIVLNLQATIFH